MFKFNFLHYLFYSLLIKTTLAFHFFCSSFLYDKVISRFYFRQFLWIKLLPFPLAFLFEKVGKKSRQKQVKMQNKSFLHHFYIKVTPEWVYHDSSVIHVFLIIFFHALMKVLWSFYIEMQRHKIAIKGETQQVKRRGRKIDQERKKYITWWWLANPRVRYRRFSYVFACSERREKVESRISCCKIYRNASALRGESPFGMLLILLCELSSCVPLDFCEVCTEHNKGCNIFLFSQFWSSHCCCAAGLSDNSDNSPIQTSVDKTGKDTWDRHHLILCWEEGTRVQRSGKN